MRCVVDGHVCEGLKGCRFELVMCTAANNQSSTKGDSHE